MREKKTVAVIGATGSLGSGLALRWARAGHALIIGSRSLEKAQNFAQALNEQTGLNTMQGMENSQAAAAADIVALTVPFSNQRPMLEAIQAGVQGKILIDATVPLMPPKVRTVQLPPEGSAAKAAQAFLGKEVRVVSAFQNAAASHVAEVTHAVDCDILVCGNDAAARAEVIQLIEDAGMRGWHAGRIDNSAATEALTSVLIFMNHHYKIDGAGFRITGTAEGE